MKTIPFFGLFVLVALISFSTATAQNINTKASSVIWTAYKVTGSHTGSIGIKEGKINMQGGVLQGGSFIIDMGKINCTDLQGEWKDKLEGHLKSEDFFNVNSFPEASFEITKVSPKGTPGDYKVTGNMTIKGITKEVKFYAKAMEQRATAKIVLDRTDFDVRYGSGSFFDSLGDKTIYDDFELEVTLSINN